MADRAALICTSTALAHVVRALLRELVVYETLVRTRDDRQAGPRQVTC
jgi:hypothetical protein